MLAYILRSACSDARPKWQESHLWSRFYATFSGYPDGERKHWRNHRGHWGHVPLSPKIKAYIVTHSGAKMRQNTSFQHTQKMKKILRWRHKLPHNPLIRPFPWWERDPSYTHFLRALYIQILATPLRRNSMEPIELCFWLGYGGARRCLSQRGSHKLF